MIVPPRDLGAGAAALWRYAASPVANPLSHSSLAARGNTTDERGPQLATPANIVDLVICILSFLGALAIILPYVLNKRARKLRHSLILGLATSDLATSIIVIASTSFLLSGGDLAVSKRYCDFIGYALSASVFSQHLWNMGIAIVTYMILVHPLNNITAVMERHLIWLWPIIWSIALIVNGISWRYAGWANAGGFCTFGNRGGRYYGAIISFVPRGLVVVIIIILYTHLFFFLRRTNLFSAVSHRSQSQEGNGARGRAGPRTSLRADSVESSRAPVSRSRRPSQDPSLHLGHQADGERSNGGTMSRRTSFPTGLLRYIPTFNASRRGSAASTTSKRADSASTQTPKDVFLSGAEDEGMEMGDCNRQRMLSFATSPSSPPRSNEGTSSEGRHHTDRARPETGLAEPEEGLLSLPSSPQQPHDETFSSTAQLVEPPRPSNARRPSTADAAGSRPRPAKLDLAARHVSANVEPRAEVLDDATADDESDDFSLDPYKPLQRMKPRRDVRDFQMVSSPREHLKHYALSHMRTQGAQRATGADSAPSSHPASPRTARTPLEPASVEPFEGREKNAPAGPPRFDDMLGDDWTWGMEVGGQDTAAAQSPAPAPHVRHASQRKHGDRKRSKWWRHSSRHAGGLGGNDRADQNGMTSTGSTVDEHGVESLGSTLNRQASVLMLLYPLAYCLLFSVSIARIITDFTQPAPAGRVKDPNEPLRAVSRWFIFAQGAFDAIIFQIVERHFRKRMKRKRQIAAGELVPQTWWEQVCDHLMLRTPPPASSTAATS